MLTTATVTKIDCNFVHAIYSYLYNRKYSLEVCLDEATTAYLLHLKAHSTCLTYEDECDLSSLSLTDYSLDCEDISTSSPCATVGTITLASADATCTYSTAARNPANGSAYPYLTIDNDSVYHKAHINLDITTPCDPSYLNSIPVESGTVLAGTGFETTSTDFDFAVLAQHILTGVKPLTTSYIKTIRLYHTDSFGALFPTPDDIDVAPTTSPYLSCGGCTPVTDTHLYFGHANYITALTNVIQNAVKVLSGDASNISVKVADFSSDGYQISFRSKHNPSGTFYGVKHSDAKLTWRNTPISTVIAQTAITKSGVNAAISYNDTITDYCTNLVLNVPTKYHSAAINWSATDFNKITLTGPYMTNAVTIDSPSSVSCPSYTATATISPTPVSVVWKDSSLNVVSTTTSLTTSTPDTYTVTATFEDGCTAVESITFS